MKTTQYTSQSNETDLVTLEVVGTIPHWIEGKIIRNGPALYEHGDTPMKHWFDGYGMLHAFTIKNGTVSYHSAFIQSEEYINDIVEGEKKNVASWGTSADPCRSIFTRFFTTFTKTPSNTNVNIFKLGEKHYATSDIGTVTQFDTEHLTTIQTTNLTPGGVMAAHPSYEKDGSIIHMIGAIGKTGKNTIVRIKDDLQIEKLCTFKTDSLFYFHSFANEERYFMAIEQPLYASFAKLFLSGIRNYSFYDCFAWNSKVRNVLHIYDKETREYIRIPTEHSFFFFHVVNTHREGEMLIVDVCGYTTSGIVDDFYLDVLRTTGIKKENKVSLMRLTVNLRTHETKLVNKNVYIELPRINESYNGAALTFVYGVYSHDGSTKLSDSLIKYDVQKDTHVIWRDMHLIPGEPVYIQSPESGDEDGGIIMTVCFDVHKETSCVVILDAKNMTELARAYTPRHIPAALHGDFYKL